MSFATTSVLYSYYKLESLASVLGVVVEYASASVVVDVFETIAVAVVLDDDDDGRIVDDDQDLLVDKDRKRQCDGDERLLLPLRTLVGPIFHLRRQAGAPMGHVLVIDGVV